MSHFIFATESYPFTMNVAKVLAEAGARAVLLTKDVHHGMPEETRRLFTQIVEVPDFSFETLRDAIRANIRLEPDTRIVSHDDFFYETFARLNETFGLPGYSLDSILPFVNKDVMKQRLARSGISLPRYVMFDGEKYRAAPAAYVQALVGELRLPIFAKPINGAGAEGAELLESVEQLERWCAQHVGDTHYELDEYIGGATLYHCDSILQGGKAVFTQVCRYSAPCADFSRGAMVGSYTMHPGEALYGRLTQFTGEVIEALHREHPVPDGVTHMEVFHTQDGRLVFLEVQFRPPGANVRVPYQEHLRCILEEYHFRLQMGERPQLPTSGGPYAAWMYFPAADGTVESVLPLPKLRSVVVEEQYFVVPGQRTSAPRSILDAKGRGVVALSLVIKNANYEALQEDFRLLSRHVPYVVRA